MRDVAAAMSRFAGTGGVRGQSMYHYNTMHDLVYPVHGGMEDWGYAASWDPQRVSPCTPRANGGYDAARTRYGGGEARGPPRPRRRDTRRPPRRARTDPRPSRVRLLQARAFTVLVETSDRKSPPESSLGSSDGVYSPGGKGDGHVPRNVRLALAGLDLVRPAVEAWAPPARPQRCVPVSWQVWGAVTVAQTVALWRSAASSPWDEVAFGAALSEIGNAPISKTPSKPWAARPRGSGAGGGGVWAGSPLTPRTITSCVTPPSNQRSGAAQLAIKVRADPTWTQPPTSAYLPSPKSPQSHLARSRGEYTFEGAPGRRHRVRGRPFWASAPVELNCSAGGGSGGGRAAPSVVVCAALPLSPVPPRGSG